MKVIFLDIDGVLNSWQYFEDSDYEHHMDEVSPIDQKSLHILKTIVEQTRANIVLTSSWRGGWEKEAEKCSQEGKILNQEFSKVGLEIFDKTDYLEGQGSGTRAKEILKWMKKSCHQLQGFAIIDDNDFDWSKYGLDTSWIQTDFLEGGLRKCHIDPCISILENSSNLYKTTFVQKLGRKLGHFLKLR